METNKKCDFGDHCDNVVLCQSSQGFELRGTPLRMAPHLVAFEVYHPNLVLQLSEVLTPFRVLRSGVLIYSGRAVLTHVIQAGATLVCEANLAESWVIRGNSSGNGVGTRQRFHEFVKEWQRLYRIVPEYKVLMADIHSFLTDLRLWLQHTELSVRSSPTGDRVQLENELAAALGDVVVGAMDSMWERFEGIVQTLGSDEHPAYRAYLRRQLHPLLLCAPFAYRAFHKPLGYAGDYEIVNMIARDPFEGGSLFAKLVNLWLWRQPPAEAHRNRIQYLETKLIQETARVSAAGRIARIFNVACGPAIEVQRFLRQGSISESADFTLLDFDQETLEHTRSALADIKKKLSLGTTVRYVKMSVHQMLKTGGVAVEAGIGNQHDFIYCAGLFDYLSDSVCHRLVQILYGWLAPHGLLLITNVQASRPFRYSLEFILDWHLLYRDRQGIEKMIAGAAPDADTTIWADASGVNLMVEMRKPGHA